LKCAINRAWPGTILGDWIRLHVSRTRLCLRKFTEIDMKKYPLYALIAVVGLVSGGADAAIATFHCDAAPIQECHYVVFDGNGVRHVPVVKGGSAATVDNVSKQNTYCRAVDADPDQATCERQQVPLDADFKDRVRAPSEGADVGAPAK
jgi:hypothetical protein